MQSMLHLYKVYFYNPRRRQLPTFKCTNNVTAQNISKKVSCKSKHKLLDSRNN